MFKKLNIFALTLLLVGQIILGPIATVSAEELLSSTAGENTEFMQVANVDEDVEVNATGEGEEKPETIQVGSTNPEEDDESETPVEPKDPKVPVVDPSDSKNPVVEDDNESGEEDSGTAPELEIVETPKLDDEGKASEETASEVMRNGQVEMDSTSFEEESQQVTLADTGSDGPFEGQIMEVPDSVIHSTEFIIGDNVVTGNGPFIVENGQTAKFKLNLDQAGGHNYGKGSTLTYILPDIFNVVGFSTYVGDIGTVTKDGNKLTITFNDTIHDGFNGTPFGEKSSGKKAFISIEAEFQSVDNSLDATFDLPGEENIKLNFTPKTGKPVTKKNGKPGPKTKDSEYIEWEVTVNTDLKATGTVNFVDTLSTNHKFDLTADAVTITELEMNADGTFTVGSSSTATITDATKLELLLDGTKAYKIKYRTLPDDPGNVREPVTYKNTAKYGENPSVSGEAKITYSSPLEKRVSKQPSGANLVTEWEIQYNLNKRFIEKDKAVLEDAWTSVVQQTLSDFQVFAAGADGKATGNPLNNYTKTDNGDGQGFVLRFNDNIDKEAYVIKYKTRPTDPTKISSDFSVKNTVTRIDIGLSKPAEQTYSTKTFALNKTAGDIDYKAKTIKWSITANQAKQKLNAGSTFTDTFKYSNMTLDEDSLEVTVGETPLKSSLEYTLTEVTGNGFKVTLVNETNEEVNISYTTGYNIRDFGKNTNVYKNKVVLTATGLPNDPVADDTRTINSQQKANGEKNGKYNYATQEFEWDVLLNYNYNTFTNAIFEDELSEGQKVTEIKVYEGTLKPNGDFVQGAEVTVSNTATEDNKIYLDLGPITTPHKVVYKSKDADGVYPVTSDKVKIKNQAKLTQVGKPLLNSNWSKTVGINYTDKLIDKKGVKQNGSGIKWDFKFNYAQSNLTNVVIKDTLGVDSDGSPEQIIDPATFKVFKVTLSGTTSDSSGTGGTPTLVETTDYDLKIDITTGKFILKLPDGNQAYHVEYETTYFGPSKSDSTNSNATNSVNVTYNSTERTSASQDTEVANFTYANAGSTTKVPFVVIKTDRKTGLPMKDVEFTLYSKFNPAKPLISKKTDENGVFDLGIKLTETEYTLKETPVAGYATHEDIKFKLSEGEVKLDGEHKGKQVVEVKNTPLTTSFKVQKVNESDEPLVGAIFKLQKQDGTDVAGFGNLVSDTDGWITVNENLEPGNYQLVETKAPVGYKLLENPVTFNISDQQIQILELAPIENAVNENSVTLLKYKENRDGTLDKEVPLQGAEFTLYKKDGTVVTDLNGEEYKGLTTDNVGELLVEGLEVGTYYFLETKAPNGYQLDRNTKHEFEITAGKSTVIKVGNKVRTGGGGWIPPAPTCDNFTVTVKQDGTVVEANTEITLKDSTGKEVATGKTDKNGEIKFDKTDLPEGTYTVTDKDGKDVGTITVTYEEDKCQAEVNLLPIAPTCGNFTLTITDTPNVKVDIKDKAGTVIVSGTTDANGKVVFSQPIQMGEYDVYVNNQKLSSITVTNDCKAEIDPEGPGTEPEKPTEPEEPGTEPEKPTEPEEPGTEPEKPTNPEEPSGKDSEDLNGENPTKPGDNGNLNPDEDDKGQDVNGNVKPDTGDNSKDNGVNKLPQTGEEVFLYMLVLGILFVTAGGWMFCSNKRKKV